MEVFDCQSIVSPWEAIKSTQYESGESPGADETSS